jgi:hypothetical protein
MERPTKERLKTLREEAQEGCLFDCTQVKELLAEIDALANERDAAVSASEINFAAKRREREALRRGFDAGQRWNCDGDRPEFSSWEHFIKHLTEEEEHEARIMRIAEAEEAEKWPQDP